MTSNEAAALQTHENTAEADLPPAPRPALTPIPSASAIRREVTRKWLVTIGKQLGVAVGFVAVAVLFRGWMISDTHLINPDEMELIAQARAALRNPVPFTTWTTSTVGPIWVWLLALFGVLGAPLTVTFAHLLASVMIGLLGYFSFTLARRWLGAPVSLVITLFWWFPIVVCFAGEVVDFGPLATELLPCLFLFIAASLPPRAFIRRPNLYLVAGLLSGLAVCSKYQAVALALALLVVQWLRAGDYRLRTLVRAVLLWGAAAAIPFVVTALTMLLSPDVSTTALIQNLNFLTDDGGHLMVEDRLDMFRALVQRFHLALMVLAVVWLGSRSFQRTQLCRLILVLGGLSAAFIGGHAFGHYLYFTYTAIAMAIAMPVRSDMPLVPRIPNRSVATAVLAVVAMVAWVLSFGIPEPAKFDLVAPHDLSVALSRDGGAQKLASLAAVCPDGSNVLVWGWSDDLYVNYSYVNAIPFLNVLQLTRPPKNHDSGYTMVRAAIENPRTDCVIDAVGPPFLGFEAKDTLTNVYPGVADVLREQYVTALGAIPCDACLVWVRRTQ